MAELRITLKGPPASGKTRIADFLASKLGEPIYRAAAPETEELVFASERITNDILERLS